MLDKKLIYVIFLMFAIFFCNQLKSQSIDTTTVINCFTNHEDLELRFTSIGSVTGNSIFKVFTHCDNQIDSIHNGLNIDSVSIHFGVTTNNSEAKISVILAENLSTFFKKVNIYINNVIDIDQGYIDSGSFRNNPFSLDISSSSSVDNTIKVIVDVFESDSIFRQDTLSSGF